MTDDAELVRQFAEERSEAAFRELVDRHLNLVYSAALRRVGGDAHLAQDVAQQVFVSLAQRAASLQHHRMLAGWLYIATRYTAAQAVRGERRRQARERDASLMNDIPASDPAWERLRPLLDDAMDHLQESDREALLLRFFEGKSLGQVGDHLNLTTEATRKRIDRALDRLRLPLVRHGMTSTATAVAMLLESQTVIAAPAALAASVTEVALSAGGTSFGGILHLMTTTKLATATGVLGALVAVTLATYEFCARHAAQNELVAIARENEVLAHDLVSVERQTERLRDEPTAWRPQATDRRAAPAENRPAATPSNSLEQVRDPARTGREFLEKFPEASVLLADNTRASKAETYDLLFRQLGLSAVQIESFLSLMEQGPSYVRWNTAKQAPIGEIGSGHLSQEELDRGLRQLLGDQGFVAYQEFDRIKSARSLVAQLGGSIYFTVDPLTSGQADQLTRLVAESSASFRAGKGVDTGALDWERTLGQAHEFLSDAQVTVLKSMRQQSELQHAMRSAVTQAMAKASQGMPQPRLVAPGNR